MPRPGQKGRDFHIPPRPLRPGAWCKAGRAAPRDSDASSSSKVAPGCLPDSKGRALLFTNPRTRRPSRSSPVGTTEHHGL